MYTFLSINMRIQIRRDIERVSAALRTTVPFCATRISGKGLKEGSVTLRYLGVLPSDDRAPGGGGFLEG